MLGAVLHLLLKLMQVVMPCFAAAFAVTDGCSLLFLLCSYFLGTEIVASVYFICIHHLFIILLPLLCCASKGRAVFIPSARQALNRILSVTIVLCFFILRHPLLFTVYLRAAETRCLLEWNAFILPKSLLMFLWSAEYPGGVQKKAHDDEHGGGEENCPSKNGSSYSANPLSVFWITVWWQWHRKLLVISVSTAESI